ncbi:phosphatidate cytidylyltransferase [Rhizobium sp. PAMB 3182]
MQRELQLRIISGVVMAAVVLVVTWYGGLPFRVMAAAIGLLIYYEWSTITRLPDVDLQGNAWGWISVAVIGLNVVFGDDSFAVPLLFGAVAAAALLVAVRKRSWWLPGGILYAGLSSISLAAIRGDSQPGLVAMLFVFAVVWGTDVLAYFTGRAIGGPKLAPRISPGKTWSGAIGGAVFGVLAGCAVIYAEFAEPGLWIIVIAFALSVCSQAGDLFESFVKRRFGVKDSSHLIPGHGGVMDRVDGLVFACFAAFLMGAVYAASGGAIESVGAYLIGLSG